MQHHFKTKIKPYVIIKQAPCHLLILHYTQPAELEEGSSTRLFSPNSYFDATINPTQLDIEL